MISLKEYDQVKGISFDLLSSHGYTQHAVPYQLRNKTDFGDVDVLVEYVSTSVSANATAAKFKQDMKDIFGNVKFHTCGVVSAFIPLGDKRVKVDLVGVNNLDAALFYYSYTYTSFVITAKMAANRLCFSADGIYIRLDKTMKERFEQLKSSVGTSSTGTQQSTMSTTTAQVDAVKSVYIANTVTDMCTFLGLDENVWRGGFDARDDVLTWLQGCRFTDIPTFRADVMKSRPDLDQVTAFFAAGKPIPRFVKAPYRTLCTNIMNYDSSIFNLI